jgi:hypothetical protein
MGGSGISCNAAYNGMTISTGKRSYQRKGVVREEKADKPVFSFRLVCHGLSIIPTEFRNRHNAIAIAKRLASYHEREIALHCGRNLVATVSPNGNVANHPLSIPHDDT